MAEIGRMPRKYISLSKKMSLALRHDPGKFNLTLDAEGWVCLNSFLAAMRMDLVDLEFIQENNNKKRFEVKAGKVRAYYGHSVKAIIEKEASEPPSLLYHGTPPKIAEIILKEGIKPMGRQYSHHSTDVPTAHTVGARHHPRPLVLVIDAAAAHADGVEFFWGNEDIWLSKEIPGKYISVHESYQS